MAVPLYALDGTCSDRRFPMLAGEWAIGCSHRGMIDIAIHLSDGRVLALEPPLDPRHTGAAQGGASDTAILVEAADRTRVVELSPAGARDQAEGVRLPSPPVAPPAAASEHFAALLTDRVEAMPLDARVRPTFAAHPAPWYPPALAWPLVAWVERGPELEERVWMVSIDPPGRPELLSTGTGHHRHVVSDGQRFAWVQDGGLVVWDPVEDHRTELDARTGFLSPPSLSDGVACWEERIPGTPDETSDHIDILCSDGLAARGPGHQLRPSRSGPYLLYRSEGHTWVVTAP